jgi:hypothetical protein
MTDAKTDSTPTTVATIPLTFNAGGFVPIELVAPVTIGRPKLSSLTFSGTQAVAKVSVSAPALPPDTDWNVEWTLGTQTHVSGPQAKNKGGTVEAILDLATGGDALGAFLESPTVLILRLTPDYPYAQPATVELAIPFEHPLAFRVGDKALHSWSSIEGLLVGRAVEVKLTRSEWKCHVRLRVDTPGEQDAMLDFARDKKTETWVIGMHDDTLLLPDASEGKLHFKVLLEVSADGGKGPWSTLTTSEVVVPAPALVSLGLEVGAGAQRMIDAVEPEAWYTDLFADHHVHAVGRFTGFAERFDPPFAVELWVATPIGAGPEAALVMQPLSRKRVPIDALDHGAFRTDVDVVSSEMAALSYRGATPFVIVRAGQVDPLPALQRCVSIPPDLLLFSDEDLWRKGDVFGVCSSGVSASMHLVRQSVLGGVWIAVEGEALAFYCSVLGPLDDWKNSKPSFVLESGTSKVQKDAKTVEVPNSAKAWLRAEAPLKTLGAFAGKASILRVELGAKEKIVVPPGAGRLEGLVIQPRLGPVEWVRADDGRVHFFCRTAFFPKKSQTLVATLIAPPPLAFKNVVYADKGRVGDGGLEFLADDADRKLCEDLLGAKPEASLRVHVGLPAPKTALDDAGLLVVPPLEGTPVPARS